MPARRAAADAAAAQDEAEAGPADALEGAAAPPSQRPAALSESGTRDARPHHASSARTARPLHTSATLCERALAHYFAACALKRSFAADAAAHPITNILLDLKKIEDVRFSVAKIFWAGFEFYDSITVAACACGRRGRGGAGGEAGGGTGGGGRRRDERHG